MTSLVIGLVLVLVSAGGFMATQSLLVLPILAPGIVLALVGRRIMTTGITTMWLAVALTSSLVPMLFFATALPRTLAMLVGSTEPGSGPIFAVGVAALLCLLHATLSLRQLVRHMSSEAEATIES